MGRHPKKETREKGLLYVHSINKYLRFDPGVVDELYGYEIRAAAKTHKSGYKFYEFRLRDKLTGKRTTFAQVLYPEHDNVMRLVHINGDLLDFRAENIKLVKMYRERRKRVKKPDKLPISKAAAKILRLYETRNKLNDYFDALEDHADGLISKRELNKKKPRVFPELLKIDDSLTSELFELLGCEMFAEIMYGLSCGKIEPNQVKDKLKRMKVIYGKRDNPGEDKDEVAART